MKKSMLLSLFALVLFGFASQSQAGFLLEPSIGYLSSEVKLTDSSAVEYGGKGTGVAVGARVGYMFPIRLWLAADISMASGATFKGETSAYDGKVDTTNGYFDIGYNFPMLARVWFGYGLSNKAKIKFDSGTDSTVEKGTNMKVGAGFNIIPHLSLNVEYIMHNYSDGVDSAGTAFKTADVYDKHTETGIIVSVSAPFNF